MNIKNIILASVLAAGAMTASAQENVKTEEVFNPHWYVQGQLGFQHTLGEVDFSDLNSFNFQVGVGYQFTQLWGTRFSVNGMNSKAGFRRNDQEYDWKWKYIAPSLDVTFNLTNAIGGYKYKRAIDFYIFAGVGANFAWGNDEAADANKAIAISVPAYNQDAIAHVWTDNVCNFVGRLGAMADWRLNDHWSLGLEFNANVVNDHYNSKHAKNADWYFNTLAGITYKFGKTHKTRTTPLETSVVEKEVIREVHDTIYINVETPTSAVSGEAIRRDVFFVIRGSEVSKAEMPKVEDIAAYLNKYPQSKVTITGYADKGTGSAKINQMYSQKRADMVADILKNKFGIAADRITTTAKGDTEQPYEQNELNRVSIMVAE